jgi:hypothetical protein
MLNGVMLLWFVLMGISLLFVAVDIRTTPELYHLEGITGGTVTWYRLLA